jgi:hypothetical protein
MWGRERRSWIVGAELAFAVGVLANCGGRSARHIPGEGAGASGGSSGNGSVGGGAAGRPAGAGGMGEVLGPCGISTVNAEAFPPLVLLLDGSEHVLFSGGDGSPRWDAVKAGVLSFQSTLRDGSRFGVAVARETDEPSQCSDPALVLPAAPLDRGHRRMIEATLAGAVPGGKRAHVSTYAAVVDALDTLGGHGTTANIVVVGGGVRTGEPMCGVPSDASVLVELGNLAYEAGERGIATFGLGIDGSSEEYSFLVLLGSSSGTCSINVPDDCLDDLSGQPDLSASLDRAFRDRALRDSASCTFPLASVPSERRLDPDKLTFTLTQGGVTDVVERTTAPCSSGWLPSEDGTSVVLCPDTCEAFRGDTSTTLKVAMACDGPPPRN